MKLTQHPTSPFPQILSIKPTAAAPTIAVTVSYESGDMKKRATTVWSARRGAGGEAYVDRSVLRARGPL